MAELTEEQKRALLALVSEHGISDAESLCSGFFSELQLRRQDPEHMRDFLLGLQSGAYTDTSEVNRIFRHFTGSLFREYTVLAIGSGQPDDSLLPVIHALSALENCWCAAVPEGILCLQAHNRDMPDFSAICAALRRHRLTAGSSRPFADLTGFRESWLQALDTLKTALALQHYGSFAQYDDFLMIRLLDQVRDNVNLDFFALPDTVILQEYDKAHHTELCRTMLCYLQHSKNVAGTAAELNIHRNTVHYRIGKCSELLPALDFENDYITFLLMLSLHIAEYHFYRERKQAETVTGSA